MTRYDRLIQVVDSHTAGSGTRVIMAGVPPLKGRTVAEKKQYFESELHHIRTALAQEPRGTKAIVTVLCEHEKADADYGLFFEGVDMCIHGTIGVVTTLAEMGMIEVREPETIVKFDTPSGRVVGTAHVEGGAVRSVSIRNVPSFFCKSTEIEHPELGRLPIDIAFGGNFYGFVREEDVGIPVRFENTKKLFETGLTLAQHTRNTIKVQHPTFPEVNQIHGVAIYGKPLDPKASSKNIMVGPEGALDRSPCGTGTSARLAQLYAKGQLQKDDKIINESIIGTLFEGKIVGTVEANGYKAIIPEITGTAHITGTSTFMLASDDPLRYGFKLPL